MQQRIVGFHQDRESHWVADLECGHSQHIRHDPPYANRKWILSAYERKKRIGILRECKECETATLDD